MLAAVLLGPASAAPYLPTGDDTVLERLPEGDRAAREARSLAAMLARTPNDLDLALRVARLQIQRGQTLGDPRHLGRAEAALLPWIDATDPPPAVRLLRGVLRQSTHDFNGALADLGHVIDSQPANAPTAGQARLTRAVVHQVRADYALAQADCGAIVAVVPRAAATACVAGVASLTGRARPSMILLARVGMDPAGDLPSRIWALTLLGEIGARLGDDRAAEQAFVQARALAPDDTYLLGAFADLLLDTGRLAEVVTMLADRTRVDPLLLRLAEAERRMGQPNMEHEARLADQFETSRRRGETVHRREEARYRLRIAGDPVEALRLAEANWLVQREPADARILLEAAAAAGQPSPAAPATAWLERNGVEDVRVRALAERAKVATAGMAAP